MELRRITIFIICLATCSFGQDSDDEINLDPNEDEPKCTARNGEIGLCVFFDRCNEEHTIVPGGDLHETELRSKDDCPGQLDWCCTMEQVSSLPEVGSAKNNTCFAPDSSSLPWTVALYKVTEKDQTAKNAFCLGALIGKKVILTAATCLLSAQKKVLYAKVPASVEPNKKYMVFHRNSHHQFNSGSHVYDFGILVLEEEVKWREQPGPGACISSQKADGICLSFGLKGNNDITSTVLNVKKDGCNNYRGNASIERFCGVMDDITCSVSNGAPVVCESSKGGLVVVGVARSGCRGDQVLVGSIHHSFSWITKQLESMKVQKDVYTQT